MKPLLSILAMIVAIPAAGAGQAVVSDVPDQRITVAAAGVVAMPQADADDVTDTSLGVGGSFVYWINHHVGVVGAVDYIFGNTKQDVVGDDVDIYFYSLNVGARVTTRDRQGLQPFGELTIGRHTAGYDAPGADDSQSDLGFRFGGGITYRTRSGLALVGQLAYSTAEIEDADINAFLLDLGVAWDL